MLALARVSAVAATLGGSGRAGVLGGLLGCAGGRPSVGAVDMGAVVDSAVIVGTDPAVVVSAQELRAWTDAEVEATTFRCCGCTVEMYPKAHRPDRRVQAHFATKPLRQHVNCTLVDETAAAGGVIAGGPPGRLPVLRPTRLVESEDRKISGEPPLACRPVQIAAAPR